MILHHTIQVPEESEEISIRWEITPGSLNAEQIYEESFSVSPDFKNDYLLKLGSIQPLREAELTDTTHYIKIYVDNDPHSLYKINQKLWDEFALKSNITFSYPADSVRINLQDIATPLPYDEAFTCNNYILYEGWFYRTVQMGTQCWFAENLNVGTRIETIDSLGKHNLQGTSCIDIQKYCFANDERNCDVYGGLYQWNQAMCGQTEEKSRGICPEGWHIPSHDEWTILERWVCTEIGNTDCEKKFLLHEEEPPFYRFEDSFRGTNEASFLRTSYGWGDIEYKDDPFGFSVKPALTSQVNGTFRRPLSDYLSSFFQSSTIDDSGYHPKQRSISTQFDKIFRCNCQSISGISVRCVKDD